MILLKTDIEEIGYLDNKILSDLKLCFRHLNIGKLHNKN